MGTSYHITFKAPKNLVISDIQTDIDERLAQINASMSTYDKNSTVSKFNALSAGQTIQIDKDFINVLNDSRLIYKKSHGAFDPTVYPLVELWGFGSSMDVTRLQSPPTKDEIQTVRDKVGLDKVILTEDKLSKSAEGVGLDFSAIAKGYGVDVIAEVLRAHHVSDYMVEIGGEIATLGVNDKGKPWTLAIDQPIVGSTTSDRQIATTISFSQPLHLATSGNYRNTLEYDGIRYSHTISPITAQPVVDGTASVTVVHDSTALADGWATALSAMPLSDAVDMAEQAGIKALFINPSPAGGYTMTKTPAYQVQFGY